MKNNDLLKTHEVMHITPDRHFQCLKRNISIIAIIYVPADPDEK